MKHSILYLYKNRLISNTISIAFNVLLVFTSLFSISCNVPSDIPESRYTIFPANDTNIQYFGRFDLSNTGKAVFAWSGSSIRASFEGSYCAISLTQIPIPGLAGNVKYNASYYSIFIDDSDVPDTILKAAEGNTVFVLGENFSQDKHTVTIYKRTEPLCGRSELLEIHLENGKKLLPPPSRPLRRIEFIGNSITCGYGNEGMSNEKFTGATENSYLTFGAITAGNLNAEYTLISYAGLGVHLNSDSSTINTIPDKYDRICPNDSTKKWDFSSWIPHAVVINLGTNDFGTIGGIPDSLAFIAAYEDFIQRVHTNYPDATIFCINGPMPGYPYIDPNSGEQITSLDVLRNYINKTVDNSKSTGINNIYTFSLSEIDSSIGYGAEGHPSVYQHSLNAVELTAFVKEKMGW